MSIEEDSECIKLDQLRTMKFWNMDNEKFYWVSFKMGQEIQLDFLTRYIFSLLELCRGFQNLTWLKFQFLMLPFLQHLHLKFHGHNPLSAACHERAYE